ncbi:MULTISPECIES: single-stranded DNA-binding protein [unclassified Paraflavitalea]|uniref:single-stranded DNA-binding protein n=1 Tax=unclassified Paraflavitalea TaxID=2798305 RepID=UPI003D339D67
MYEFKNRIQLIGHLGQDPEIKIINNDRKLAKLNIATNDQYVTKDGVKKEDTQWHSVNIWGKSAETAEKYLKKGAEIYVEGKLIYNTYVDKDGVKRTRAEIEASGFLVLSPKPKKEPIAA